MAVGKRPTARERWKMQERRNEQGSAFAELGRGGTRKSQAEVGKSGLKRRSKSADAGGTSTATSVRRVGI